MMKAEKNLIHLLDLGFSLSSDEIKEVYGRVIGALRRNMEMKFTPSRILQMVEEERNRKKYRLPE